MTQPVAYLEISSPDLDRTVGFFEAAFGWSPQPFAAPDYLVAPHGDAPGIDTAITVSRDGAPRSVPVIRVPELDAAMERVATLGGTVVVEPFTITGVGRGLLRRGPRRRAARPALLRDRLTPDHALIWDAGERAGEVR